MHALIVIREPPPPFTFLVNDVVEIMGYKVGEEEKLIAHGKMINVERRTVHEVPIYEGCLSMEMHKSEDDEFVIFKCVEMGNPPMRKIGKIVENFLL